tara:strand:+ start:76 stop:621 length:546 start_codon:yes stop_codon:yes gene_type:complete
MIQKVKINKVFSNPVNPRVIKEDKFQKLVKSIKEFPEMLQLRPIVVNSEMGILGGNMRFKACQELGHKEVYIIKAENLTEEQMKSFVIKDNVGFGEWDWDILANEWDSEFLNEWGLDVWKPEENLELDDFFNEEDLSQEDKTEKNKIVLEYTQEDYDAIIEILNKQSGSKEKIIYDLIVNK